MHSMITHFSEILQGIICMSRTLKLPITLCPEKTGFLLQEAVEGPVEAGADQRLEPALGYEIPI